MTPPVLLVADWQIPIMLADLEAAGHPPTRAELDAFAAEMLGRGCAIRTYDERPSDDVR